MKNKPGFTTVCIRNVPDKLWDRLKMQAKKEHKIFSYYVIELLEKAIREIEKNDK